MEFSFCPVCGKECVSSRATGLIAWICWECGKLYRVAEVVTGHEVADTPLYVEKLAHRGVGFSSKLEAKLLNDKGVS